jgi:multiple sugar transport system permease protein
MHISKTKRTVEKTVVYFLLLIGLVVVLMPFIWMVSTSLKDISQTFTTKINIIPKKIIWMNYINVWKVLPFGRFFLNSFLVSTIITVVQVFICSMAAFAFSRLQWPGRDKVFVLYLAAMMIPGQVILIPDFLIVRFLGAINSLQGIILPQLFGVFGVFLLRQFFLTIPFSLDEAAIIDGCGYFKIYTNIILPLAKPGLAAMSVFSFMFSWNNFLWPLVVINDETKYTLPLGIVSFQGQFSTDWPMMMAAACLAMLPILIIYAFAQKYFIEGIALTGMANA